MPVLSALFASVEEATTTSTSFVNAAETSALASGVDYLVLVTSTLLAPSSNSTLCEGEVDYGGTRYAFSNFIGATNFAPDSATGGTIQTAFVVTGDGSSTVAVRIRQASGSGTVTATSSIVAIPLDSLTEGTHYWEVQATNSDTLTNPAAGSGWQGSGDQVSVTPAATGDFLVIGSLEAAFTSGHSSTDQARMRCRITEDPSGTPSESNLMASPAQGGVATQYEGGMSWDLSHSQRFLDVIELTSGTEHQFEMEYEGVAGTANTGYRRARIIVLDLSVWPEFFYERDLDGESGQLDTFGNVTSTAPSAALDYVLLSAVTHQNGNSFIRAYFDTDPTGTGTQVPDPGFGFAVEDAGVSTTADDFILLPLQWEVLAETGAQTVGIECVADNNNCRWGAQHGVFPGATSPNSNGVSTPIVIWGMETSTVAAGGPIDGTAAGTSTATGTLTGTAAAEGTAAGSTALSATLAATGALAGTAAGVSTTSAQALAVGSIAGAAVSTTSTIATLVGVGALVGQANGTTTAAATNSNGIAGLAASIAFVGNSYTQNYNSLPSALQYYLDQRLPTNTTSLGPPPYQATSINSDTDGWFQGMSLGGMAYYPTIDQSGGSGSTDAVDHILAQASDAYDYVVLTSGFFQDDTTPANIDYEMLIGTDPNGNPNTEGTILEITREIIDELDVGGSTAEIIIRMTQEGYNANTDSDLADAERLLGRQMRGARQLEREGIVALVTPDHYVWSRLQWGAFGSTGSGVNSPVAAYTSLTHTNSSQAGGRNYAWLNRSQGDTAPFNTNGHQNIIATIVHVWLYGYLLWDIDPRGDTTFASPTGLPQPFDDLISTTGRIYGGHNTGLGNLPYDTGVNPGGPPDSELDLDWSSTTQEQIQDIIVAAVDDYRNHTTEFDGFVEGSSSGSTVATGTLTNSATQIAGSADGSTTSSSTLVGTGALAGTTAGSTALSGTLTNATPTGSIDGTTAGSTTATSTLTGTGALVGTVSGATAPTGTLTGSGALVGTTAGDTEATGTITAIGALQGSADGSTVLNGTLLAQSNLGGTSAGATVLSGSLTATGALAGTISGSTTPSGTLTSTAQISGTSAGATTLTGTLQQSAALAGTVSGSTSLSGTLTGTGELSGTINGSTTVVGAVEAAFAFGTPTVITLPPSVITIIRIIPTE